MWYITHNPKKTNKDEERFTFGKVYTGERVFGLKNCPVTTGCRVRSGSLTRTSRGVDEHLCNESGARLDSQAGDKMY